MNYKIEVIDFWSLEYKDFYASLKEFTKPINETYPQQEEWLDKTFFPGLENGSRKIVVAYGDNNLKHLIGVSLLKDTEDEKKICCLYVRDDCRCNGIGNALIKKSCETLKVENPAITVADKNLTMLKPLLDKNGFIFSYKNKGVYLESDTENYFNNKATEVLKKDILPALLAYKLKNR